MPFTTRCYMLIPPPWNIKYGLVHHFFVAAVTTNHGTSLNMDCKYEP
jgi:hypothetical protein